MSKILVIKRYANRKMYNVETSQYVTTTDLETVVKSGREVMVVDNVSKRDITAKTLLTVFFENARKRDDIPLEKIVSLIETGI